MDPNSILTDLSTLTFQTLLPAVVLLGIGLLVVKGVMKLIDRSLARSRLEKAAVSLIRSLLRVVLYVLLGMIVAERLGVNVSGVLALSTVVSLAVSLSLQDMLANIVGGFTVLTNHPFKAGDYVEVAGQSGTVQSIDITYTKLTTPDNKVISIPNSSVVSSQIVNYSTSESRRVEFSVSVSYDAPIAQVKQALLEAAQVDQVLQDPTPFVGLSKYGESAMEYTLRLWVPNSSYWDVYYAVNEEIQCALQRHGVTMTYPHLTVHLEQ